jgi:uncharacterized membrane protein (UPF0127 family)
MILVNTRTNEAIASEVTLALTRASRRQGLLQHESLDVEAALVLSPCWAIHTMFMRFAIDVIFVDTNGTAIRIVRELAPWRIAAAYGAQSTIELAAGSLRVRDVQIGDTFCLDGDVSGGRFPITSAMQQWPRAVSADSSSA